MIPFGTIRPQDVTFSSNARSRLLPVWQIFFAVMNLKTATEFTDLETQRWPPHLKSIGPLANNPLIFQFKYF